MESQHGFADTVPQGTYWSLHCTNLRCKLTRLVIPKLNGINTTNTTHNTKAVPLKKHRKIIFIISNIECRTKRGEGKICTSVDAADEVTSEA